MKNTRWPIFLVLAIVASVALVIGCGRSPSRLLRQGMAPVFDFPLYVSGGPGKVWKFDRDGARTVLLSGLNDPKGIATDQSNNLYVVEQGNGRVLKVNVTDGTYKVLIDGLSTPGVVAVDSFGDVYVTQEGTFNIIRARDQKIISTFTSRPTALAFGVQDIMLIGLFDVDLVQWGVGGSQTTVTKPVNVGTDSNGRVYVAEGSDSGARIFRYQQKEPQGQKTVADNMSGITGFVVDPDGNLYMAEAGASRINLITFDGKLFVWVSGVTAPESMAFTQY